MGLCILPFCCWFCFGCIVSTGTISLMTVHVESKCGDPVLDWTAFRADSYPGYIMELS